MNKACPFDELRVNDEVTYEADHPGHRTYPIRLRNGSFFFWLSHDVLRVLELLSFLTTCAFVLHLHEQCWSHSTVCCLAVCKAIRDDRKGHPTA